MISGDNVIKVFRYRPIDHCGEGCGSDGWVIPAAGERFRGIPHGYKSDNSAPYIEVEGEAGVLRTINAMDCSEIQFEEEAHDLGGEPKREGETNE